MARVFVFVLPLLLCVVGCTQRLETHTGYDHSADFAAAKTYSWAPVKQSGTQNRAIGGQGVDALLVEFVDRELAAKGMTKVDTAAAKIVVHSYTKLEYVSGRETGSESGTAYQDRQDQREDPIPRAAPDDRMPTEYKKGTVVLDLVDQATGKSIWRGVANGAVRDVATAEERQARLDEVVRKLLADYPPKSK